ncbi:MAG: helix-turn-helix domain-containing protein [Bacteroidales bacterium]|nr:helix-turn-helix domain-containing protein [Bacteroidales bacterium]
MRRALSIIAGIFVIQTALWAGVTEDDFPFVHINRSNSSISYDGISRIFQDSRGFLWIGTFKGLNRFDGERFTVYDKDDLGVASDFIHSLAEDSEGNVWVGTDRGVTVYDFRSDSFIPFRSVSDAGTVIDNKVNNISFNRGKVWLTVNHQGMFSYDLKSGELKNYFVTDGNYMMPQGIRRFLTDSNGDFWIALYYTDLYKATPSLDSLQTLSFGGGSFVDDNVEGMAQSEEAGHIIYIVTVRNGLCEIDFKQGNVKRLLAFPDDAVPLELCLDSGRCIWIPTTKGLYRYDLEDGSHIVLKENKNNRFSLSDNYVFSVYVDSEGGIWAGTKDGGLNYSGPEQKNFAKYYSCAGKSLENSIVSGFADDGHGTVWVTTEKEGLFRYDVARDRLFRYELHEFRETICSPCLYGGDLWLGSLKGLVRLDPVTGRVRRYASFATASVEDNKCFVVYATDSGELYVGTTLGLMRYDAVNDGFVQVKEFSGRFITGIDEDSKGCLWVSTYADGLWHFNPADDTVINSYRYPDGLPTNKLSGVHVDGRDRVWAMGFSFGFYLFDRADGRFVQFSRKTVPDLPSDVVFSAVDDRAGNIWVSTDVGIICFKPDSKDVSLYTTTTGLLDDVMKKGVLRDSRGNIFFASQNGFVRFNPEHFHAGDLSPNIVITDFRVGDEVMKPGPGSPLSCNVDIADEIRLRPGQNSFGISASLLSFSTGANNRILCFLEGYDKSPRIVSGDKSVFWYNVPAGTYRLLVRGSNTNGKWNVSHKPILITVERPLLATPGAIVVYVLLLLAVFSILAELYSRRLEKKERERLEAFECELEIAVHSDKPVNVLLIADDVSVRQQVKNCLEQEYNVVSAMTGKRGFVILDTVKINLIIADIDTRYFEGEEFCRMIREDKAHSRIPILILSADASTKKKIAYMDKGAALFMEKPLSGEYLQSAIRNLFNKEMSIESAISQSIVSMKIHRLKLDSKDEDFLNLLEKTVIENLSNTEFSSSDLETSMAMSRSSLVRRMKSLLDTTPNEYIKQKRLAIAAKMLEGENVRVNEICYAVGFKYPSYFTKCFKEVYGLLPAEYRNRLKKYKKTPNLTKTGQSDERL